MGYPDFALLIRNHDADLDHWLTAMMRNDPNHLNALAQGIQHSSDMDVRYTVKALDDHIQPMQMDMYLIGRMKGQRHRDYQAISQRYEFLLSLLNFFEDAGYFPGDGLPFKFNYR